MFAKLMRLPAIEVGVQEGSESDVWDLLSQMHQSATLAAWLEVKETGHTEPPRSPHPVSLLCVSV